MKTKPIDLNAIEVIALLSNGNVQIRRKVKPKCEIVKTLIGLSEMEIFIQL